MHVVVAGLDAEQHENPTETQPGLLRRDRVKGTADAFRPPGGARRVIHDGARRAIWWDFGGLAAQQTGEAPKTGDFPDSQAPISVKARLLGRRCRHGGKALMSHEHLGLGVSSRM